MPAKKAPKNPGRDARRAFEHLGRVQAMANSLSVGHSPLATLVSAADAAFQSGKFEESAHLLRAAEHLLFAAIVNTSQGKTPPLLLQAIEEEFEHLNERAADHGHGANLTREIRSIYSQMTDDAAKCMRARDYRRALELARGAEALTHVSGRHHEPKKLPDSPKRLKA